MTILTCLLYVCVCIYTVYIDNIVYLQYTVIYRMLLLQFHACMAIIRQNDLSDDRRACVKLK